MSFLGKGVATSAFNVVNEEYIRCPNARQPKLFPLGAVHFLLRAQMAGMAGASPGPSINRGHTTIHGQRAFQRRIVVASLAGAMLADASKKESKKEEAFFMARCYTVQEEVLWTITALQIEKTQHLQRTRK